MNPSSLRNYTLAEQTPSSPSQRTLTHALPNPTRPSLQIEVHQKFRCVPETLYLTVNLIDRFLEIENVERSKLQLVGVTALLVSACLPCPIPSSCQPAVCSPLIRSLARVPARQPATISVPPAPPAPPAPPEWPARIYSL